MSIRRTVLVAAGAALLLPFASPALGADVTAAGSATSSATVMTLSAAGHTISVGTLSAVAQTISSAAPSVNFVPVTVDGTKTGEVTVDPSSSPKTVGGVTSSGVPAAVLSVTSPSAELTAAKPASGPSSGLVAGLGSASVLGIPLTIDGDLNVGSATTAAQAQATKALTIGQVSLPSIADLLAALGLDLSALPVDTLNGLLDQLPLTLSSATTDAAAAANTAIDSAQQAADDAQQAVDDQEAVVASLEGDVADAQATFDTALAASGCGCDQAAWEALPDVAKQAFAAAYSAWTTLQGLESDLADANTTLDGLQQDLTDALAALADAISDLVAIVMGALDATPIAEIGSADVSTKALVAGATKTAAVTGQVSGVKVLGQDVLAAVFGSSTLDVAELLGTGAGTVNSAIATATGTLSSVLSAVTGATGLVVPAPVITVMQKTTKTGTVDGFGTADVTLSVLKVTLGSLTIPTALALPNAVDLPGVTQTATGFTTDAMSLEIGAVVEGVKYRAGTQTPGTGLPATGAPIGLAVLATVALAGGLGFRKFVSAAA